MGWQLWLAAPLVVTLSAAVVVWWRGRAAPTPSVHVRVHDHSRFLGELGRHARPVDELPRSVILEPAQAPPSPVARA